MLEAGARVFGYRYNGYWQDVGTIQSFWEANMALLEDDPELDLYDKDWVIHTRSEERAPAKVGPTAQVHRSLISHGCVINGTVVNSVLSPGVRVDVGAVVRDSIVMFDSVIRSGAVVDRSILDKEVVVGQGAIVGDGPYDDRPNKQEPGRLNTGITVVGKRAVIPRGARIGRNVKVAADVRTIRLRRTVVKSGESVERQAGAPRASRTTADQHRAGHSEVVAGASGRHRRPAPRRSSTRADARRGRSRRSRLDSAGHVIRRPWRARRVRPADVERWLTDLGLEPVERAERDGIASWDLVLDGRRRFDLRVTVILDPALALICWAHYAPPISDMFRKSYRKLLRWNDEFPFAKFWSARTSGRCSRSSCPIERSADADALGLAIARILGIADRLLDESKDWLWLGGRMPDHGRPDARATRRSSTATTARLPELRRRTPSDAGDDRRRARRRWAGS